jgi:uncharacterized LabA/DUF88 family protein
LRRICVFVDYQNAYMQARRCFCPVGAPGRAGQFDPGSLGELVVRRRRATGLDGRLHEVRVYRGLPDATRDSRSNAAVERQTAAWTQDRRVAVVTRPLRYPRGGGRPQEKGIDVRLAVDFVTMALRNEYDVGVLMSHDTDLLPALEAVVELAPTTCVEVAAWAPTTGRVNRLRIARRQLWCHYLSAIDYAAVADGRSYAPT